MITSTCDAKVNLMNINSTKNKVYYFVFVLVAIVVGFFVYKTYFSQPTQKMVTFEGDAVIKMGEDTYSPQDIQIKKGAKVTFVNESGVPRWPASDLHPSHLVFSDFDPKEPVANGTSWSFTFDKAGEWGYHDHLAPYITGVIKVIE